MSFHLQAPLLALDTTLPPLSVALLDGRGGMTERISADRAGSVLHDLVRDLLGESGLAAGDLRGIAATRGPGSFTGLRVGLSAASGLALVTGTPVLGIETTRALALASGRVGTVAAILEGGQGRVFVGLHEVTTTGATALLPDPVDAGIDEALDLVARADHAVLRGAPPGAERLRAAGCVAHDGALAPAVARLALGAEASQRSLEALYARPPAIRAPGA